MNQPKMLTVQQIAVRFETTERTIQRWVKAGKFPGVVVLNPTAKRSQVLIPIEDVEALEQERASSNGKK
jgi:excisionase family DNA binding protein